MTKERYAELVKLTKKFIEQEYKLDLSKHVRTPISPPPQKHKPSPQSLGTIKPKSAPDKSPREVHDDNFSDMKDSFRKFFSPKYFASDRSR